MASRNQAIEKYNAGKYKTALNIAKNFKIGVTDEQRSQMALGYECMAHEDTYVQMGYDCEAEINKALDILKVVLGIEEPHEEYAAEDVQVTEEVVDTIQAEEATEWMLLMKNKANKKLYGQLVHTDDIDDYIQFERREGYSFVMVATTDKIVAYLTSSSLKGFKGIHTAVKPYADAFNMRTVYEFVDTVYANLRHAHAGAKFIAIDGIIVTDLESA